MTTELIRYDAACRAIADAKSIDEVKDIRDQGIAMAAYARQAKNRELEADAIEIRMRATRRLDQMRQSQKDTVGLNTGAKGVGTSVRVDEKPTLASQGIDKNLAHQARQLGAMSDEKFESVVADARDAVNRAVKSVITLDGKADARADRERELAANQKALPDKVYGVIYADPEWQFETYHPKSGGDRAAGNHYPTSSTDEIAARPVGSIAAKDSVLFLWATAPMLPDALRVMEAWGFTYKSHIIWDKEQAGTGYWFRNRHELLLVGTRGKVPAPAMGTQRASVQSSAPEEHSRKPEWAARLIEQYFPNLPKIELNRRGAPRPGWDAWGNEVEQTATAA